MKLRLPLAAALLALSAACAHLPAPAAPDGTPTASPAAASPPAEPAPAPAAEPAPAGTAAPATPSRAEAAGPITFAAVGDIMLGTTFPDESKGKLLPPDDGASILREVAPVLSAADVAFGNLEGPLLDEGPSEKCKNAKPGRCWAFRVPVRYARWLKEAGFDVLSVANNHVGDFGDAGRASTRAALDSHGIRYSGAIGEVAYLDVRGARWRWWPSRCPAAPTI
ncbi:MAG: CapA family protein [Anaeromyxobacter sp.]